MSFHLSRRGGIRLISLLCAFVFALTAFAVVNGCRARVLQRQSHVAAQRALSELCENLDNITASLQKAAYVNSGAMLSRMGNELSRSAACAKVSLSSLTNADTVGEQVYKFLSQVGDFTLSLNKSFQADRKLTAKQRESLQTLCAYAQAFSDGVHALMSGYDDGDVSFEGKLKTLSLTDENAPASFDDRLNQTAQALSDTPTLLYDGPFSDTVLNRKALGVAKMDEIDAQTARDRAAKWLDCKPTELLAQSDADGTLEMYCFSKGGKSIGVTKRGGLPAYVTNPTFAGEAQISAETAVKIAAKYLNEIGYTDMKAGYYSTYDGVCTVIFHYVKDDVVYYADLIKVGVALDTARPVALDARGYLMNHTVRKLPEQTYTAEQAADALAPTLGLLGSKVALVPLDDGTEQLCHELHCRDGEGQEVLVYTSVTSGEEADLKILLYADGGVLAK